jgi:3-phosphoshikimate 1-carboxyvinyltransferase
MNLFLPPKIINSTIKLPASKSISNRALILNALSENAADIENLSEAGDTQTLQNALKSGEIEINIDNAGTAMRFLTAYFAQSSGEHILTGSAQMKVRPIGILVTALRQIGANIEYLGKEGFPPLKITAQALEGGEITMNGSVSSQFVSALMMIAPKMKRGLKIRLRGKIASRPYIEMTANLMRKFGIATNFAKNIIEILPQKISSKSIKIENDWTAASYWYEFLAVAGNGEIFLPNLTENSIQGDKIVAKIFENFGVETEYLPDGIKISYQKSIKALHIDGDLTNFPDLAQTLVVTCLLKKVRFCFTGLGSLKIKETDRISALIEEAQKIGFVLKAENDDTLMWEGETCQTSDDIRIYPHGDHRMAMAFAAAALRFNRITIENSKVVKKSYPNFWNEFSKLI